MNFLNKLLGFPLEEFNAFDIRFRFDEEGWVLAGGILILGAIWFLRTSLSRVRSPWRKTFLFIIRAAALVILLLFLLKPELELKKVRMVKNSLAVVVDNSKSMSIKTFQNAAERRDLVKRTLERNEEALKNFREKFRLDFYFSSDHLTPSSIEEIKTSYKTRAENTDLNQVLIQLSERYEGEPLKGVLLFTDGADLATESGEISMEMSRTLASFEAPIYAYQAGTNKNFKDLAIEKLQGPEFGFVFQPVRLTATISASGIGDKNIPVMVKEDGKVSLSKTLSITRSRKHYKVDLEFTPTTQGKKIYTVSVPVFSGESIEINNRKEFQVKVARDRIRVLHLNGRPSWDSRFLREVLINNPKIDLLSFFILRTLSDDVGATTSELSLIPFPSNLLLSDYLDSFDLVIFHNFKYAPFIEKKYLENIRNYVRNGGAFVMIGGELSFQGGNYERTPVEDILPVRLRKSPRKYSHRDFRLEVQQRMINHPVLRLNRGEEDLKKVWESLPDLNGFNEGLETAQDSLALITHRREGPHPILSVRKFGKGRTLALATDSSWQWNFLRVGEGGSGRYYQSFWSNAIAWLTGRPDTHTLLLESDRERYRENEKALIRIRAFGEDYNPSGGEKIKLSFGTVAKKKILGVFSLETDAKGNALFELEPLDEGFYWVRADRVSAPRENGREIRFGVFAQTAEFEKPLANRGLLKDIAKTTGGLHRVLTDKTNLGELTFPNSEALASKNTRTVTLLDGWSSFGLIAGFLVFDWWLRRKSGLS